MARPKSSDEKPLTEVELQIMNILWEIDGGTVHDVLERLSLAAEKDYAYTTVSTLLRVLERKSVVSSEKEGRGHRYTPSIQQDHYQKKALDHMVHNLFSGQASNLIRNLLGGTNLSAEELAEVRKLIDEKKKR